MEKDVPERRRQSLDESDLQLAIIAERQSVMDEHLKATDAAIAALRAERDSALKWGIITLGTAVISMATWIVNLLLDLIKFGHIKW